MEKKNTEENQVYFFQNIKKFFDKTFGDTNSKFTSETKYLSKKFKNLL